MGQLGHTDPAFTLRVYTHVMRHGDAERAALKALVEGHLEIGSHDRVDESTQGLLDAA